LVRILDTGVRVLPQRDWEERERRIYGSLRDTSIRVNADGALVLPLLAGHTLATLLEGPALEGSRRTAAIQQAVTALAEFHRLGFTHGDAMAENVLVDLEAGVAHWFDFETVHDSSRPMAWRRADDLRALLVTSLVRTPPESHAETLDLILAYADEDVARALAASFASVWRRSLTFHLAQAPLSFRCFTQIGRLLRERVPRARENVGNFLGDPRAGPRSPWPSRWPIARPCCRSTSRTMVSTRWCAAACCRLLAAHTADSPTTALVSTRQIHEFEAWRTTSAFFDAAGFWRSFRAPSCSAPSADISSRWPSRPLCSSPNSALATACSTSVRSDRSCPLGVLGLLVATGIWLGDERHM
jgi:serine/threonine protein kinase